MRSPTANQRLVLELDAAAERVNAAVAGLTDEQASKPAADGWSVKDQLTHITFWHEMRFFEVSRVARGGNASFPLTEEAGVEHINNQTVENRRSLPLSQVIADLTFAREMVKQAVLAANDLDLSRFQEVGPIGAGHEIEHAGLIGAWRKSEGL